MIKKPHEYSKRILLAVSGMSPQIVSETLYALTQQEPPFIPTEIRVITTTTGKQKICKGLFEEGYFAKLCAEYALPPIEFTPDHIEVIQDGAGVELNDIKTITQNEAAANHICKFVETYTEDSDSAVHVSIAGGRKSMGFLMGYAISLFGRPQDRLSHVLVTEQFESLPDFYYPPKEKTLLTDRAGNQHDASQAEVVLADIPFVRLSSGLPANLISRAEDLSYSDVIRGIQSVVESEPHLTLDFANKKVFVGQHEKQKEINFPRKKFGWLAWFAYRKIHLLHDSAIHCVPEKVVDENIEVSTTKPEEFLNFLVNQRIYNKNSGLYERLEKSLKKRLTRQYIDNSNTDVNDLFNNQLGKGPASPYLITATKTRKGTFDLGLLPTQITII